MAETEGKSTKVGSAVSIEVEDVQHRLIRVEGEMYELRRRCIIYERRLLAWETLGTPLRVGEASSRLPTLDMIRKELDRSVEQRHIDITALDERLTTLEQVVADLIPVDGPGADVDGGDVDAVDAASTVDAGEASTEERRKRLRAERQKRWREGRKILRESNNGEPHDVDERFLERDPDEPTEEG